MWAETLFWVGVALLAIPYGLYPWVGLLAPRSQRAGAPPIGAPPVAIVLAVHNGADALAARLDNLLAQDYTGPLQIHLGLDGCTDDTATLANQYIAEGKPLSVHTFARCGKLGVLESLLPSLEEQYPILALTDLRTLWASDTLSRLVAAFADPRIGVATAVPAQSPAESREASLEGHYLQWETRLKRAEVRLSGLLLGAFGPGYALRSAALPKQFILTPLDDLALSILAQPRGYRGAVAEGAHFYYSTGGDLPSELRRKRRFGLGGAWFCKTQGLKLLVRSPLAWLLLVSHKALRWAAPFTLLGLAALGLVLFQTDAWYGLAPALVLIGTQLGVLRWLSPTVRWPRLLGAGAYFFAAQGALLAGWFDFFRGLRGRTWQPSVRRLPTQNPSAG